MMLPALILDAWLVGNSLPMRLHGEAAREPSAAALSGMLFLCWDDIEAEMALSREECCEARLPARLLSPVFAVAEGAVRMRSLSMNQLFLAIGRSTSCNQRRRCGKVLATVRLGGRTC